MYIYKKRINGNIYYYLRISKRENGKIVVKDILNLGTDSENILKKIEGIDKKYSSQIRKSWRKLERTVETEIYVNKIKMLKIKSCKNINYDTLIELEAIKLHYNDNISKLDTKTFDETLNLFISEYSWHTASIEGNTILLKDAEKFFLENLTPSDVSIEEIIDLKNNKSSFEYMISNLNNLELSNQTIIELHKRLMEGIDKRVGFRTFNVRVLHSKFESTPYQFILTEMNELLNWYEKNKHNYHPLILAVIFHHRFEQIHPFADGNGRCGRLVLNLILLKTGYPPVIVQRKNRSIYMECLNKADKSDFNKMNLKFYEDFFEYIIDEYKNTYWINFV